MSRVLVNTLPDNGDPNVTAMALWLQGLAFLVILFAFFIRRQLRDFVPFGLALFGTVLVTGLLAVTYSNAGPRLGYNDILVVAPFSVINSALVSVPIMASFTNASQSNSSDDHARNFCHSGLGFALSASVPPLVTLWYWYVRIR